MKKILLLIILLFLIKAPTWSQQCNTFECAYQKAEQILNTSKAKDKYEKVLANLDDAENFAGNDQAKKVRVRALRKKAFGAIQREKEDAENQKTLVELEKIRSDSIAKENRRQALTAYANDLAYKSKTALRDGDRNTAFRLAEFAHSYVEADNPYVKQSLIDALYYNINKYPPLPRITALEGHTDDVSCVAISPDGKQLATGGDNTVKIWDIESGKALMTLEDTSTVWSVAFSPDGKRIASGYPDNTTKIWDLESGQKLTTLEGEYSSFWSMAFSPDGKQLAIGDWGGRVTIWDLESGKELMALEGLRSEVFSLIFTPDGKRLAAGDGFRTVKTWDIKSGEVLTTHDPDFPIECMEFSPDGKHVATGISTKVQIWDVESGEELLSFNAYHVGSLAFSLDGKQLAGSEGNTIKIWDLGGEGSLLRAFEGYSASCMAFSLDGNKLVTGSSDKTAKIWDLESDGELMRFEGKSATFSRDGKRLATALGHTAMIWDVETCTELKTLKGHNFDVWEVAFSPDGKWFATGAVDKTVKIWNLQNGEALITFDGAPSGSAEYVEVEFSPDGEFLVAHCRTMAKVWNVETGKPLLSLEYRYNQVGKMVFSPDGKQLAGAVGDTVKIWDLETGNLLNLGHPYNLYSESLAFSPDGKQLAGSIGKTIKIWDLETGKPLSDLEGHIVRYLEFSPDGKRLAASVGNTVKIWDVATNKSLIRLDNHDEDINNICFSPDGKCLATGSSDGTAKIWDLETGKVLLSLRGHTSWLNTIAFSPDGKCLATGSADQTSTIWQLTPSGLIHRWRETGPQASLILPQLQQYNLESLLDQEPGNIDTLLATHEVWQIKAFADLAAVQAGGSNILSKVEPSYARADRLYAAALALQDERLIRHDYATMLRCWAAVYRSEEQPARAGELEARAEELWKEE